MSSYLVTGGAGFMGSNLVDALLDQGHRVRVFDDLSSGNRANVTREVEFLEGDVTDPADVAQAFEGVDGCFHLAAIASVVRSNDEWLRTHQVNLTGTINVLDQARRSRGRREIPVVYASTAAVYGDSGNLPVSEQRRVAPLSAYGADKYACELHARVAGAVHGIPTIGLRFFNLYGPRQDRRSPYSGVIAIFADRLANAEPGEVTTCSHPSMSPILGMPFPRFVEPCRRPASAPRSSTSALAEQRRYEAWLKQWLLCTVPNYSSTIGQRASERSAPRSETRIMRPRHSASGPKRNWPTASR